MIEQFTLSNQPFDGAKKLEGIYYQGDCVVIENHLIFRHGVFYEQSNRPEDVLSDQYKLGIFNIIRYDRDLNELIIKNDRLGMLPLYIYDDHTRFIVSTNFWNIVKLKGMPLDLSINQSRFKAFIGCIRIPDEGATYFNNIQLLKAGTRITYNITNQTKTETRYWDLIQQPDASITLSDAVNQIDQDITRLFESLHSMYPTETFGFGNSGGMDSRIIPIYAHQFNMDLIGCTVGDPKPRKLFLSSTFDSAKKISEHFGFKTFNLSYKTNRIEQRLLLDLKNSPFGGCQVFKNPIEQAPDFNYMLCGGNGFIVSNDNNSWKTFTALKTEEEQLDFLTGYNSVMKNRLRKEKLGEKFGKRHWFMNHTFIQIFNNEDKEYFRESLRGFIRENNHKSSFSTIRTFHQRILNKHSPMGGYESLSGTRQPIYLYYPYTLDNSLKWEEDFFYNRQILRSLIIKKDKALAHIPDQKREKIMGENHSKRQFIELLIRKSGMDYLDWYGNSSFQKEFRKIMERPNPVFEQLLDINNAQQVKLLDLHPNIALDIIKAKRMVDLIHYQETDVIDNE